MAPTNFRPKYISFDIYGTLINFDIDSTTRRLSGVVPHQSGIRGFVIQHCLTSAPWHSLQKT